MHPVEVAPVADLAPAAALFHANSKIHAGSATYLGESVAEFAADREALVRTLTGAKTYPGGARVELPARRSLPRPDRGLDRVLGGRRSVRTYAARPLPFPALASLLDHAVGVTGSARPEEAPGFVLSLRAAPSGGALYPVEAYVAAFNVVGLAPGLYHFHPIDRCLETIRTGAFRDRLAPLILTGAGTSSAPAAIVLAGRWRRTLTKYGERGYRVVLLDAGHVAQNLLLVAAALDLAACPIAGFHDDAVGQELELDVEEEPVLYVVMVGTQASGPA